MERVLALADEKEDNPNRPDIRLLTIIIRLVDQLGTHVCWCPTVLVQQLISLYLYSEPEINKLNSLVNFIKEDVLQLDIPMDDIIKMEILYSTGQLYKYLPGLFLCQPLLLHQVTLQVISNILRHQVNLPCIFYCEHQL